MIKDVLRIKGVLDEDKDGCKSEWVVSYMLLKLGEIKVTMKVLEVTGIGMRVSTIFQKHASEEIRRNAKMLVRAWQCTVDEWLLVNDNNNVQEQEKEEPEDEEEKEDGDIEKLRKGKEVEVAKRKVIKETKVPKQKKGRLAKIKRMVVKENNNWYNGL